MHLSVPDAGTGRVGADAARRRHAAEALRLSRELVRAQPHRGAFVMDHVANLAAVIRIGAKMPNADRDAYELCGELERLVRGMGAEQWSRVDLQPAAMNALAVLLRAYRRLGREDEERAVARWFTTVATDPAIKWTPHGRVLLDDKLAALRGDGFLLENAAAPTGGAEAAGARE